MMHTEFDKKKSRMTSAQIIPLSFLIAIAVGTLLLMLPVSTADGETTNLLTAIFTATTSLCVTGLVVVDTYIHWSLFGKIIILIMIQLGGLGIIAVTSLLMLMIHRKFSLSQYVMIHDSFNLDSMSGLLKFLVGVFKGTFMVEGLGALIYMIVFIPKYGVGQGIWISVFTAISAFCNAGIDIMGPDSLISWNGNTLLLINTMFLIVMGGLGYVVWFDICRGVRDKFVKKYSFRTMVKRLSEHTKLVSSITVALIVSGAILVFLMEYSNPDTIGNMSLGGKVMNSIFQSVTFRTAGFASVPQDGLRESTAAMGLLFMFIGGSPVGTAGGVKTVTLFFVVLNGVSFIRNRNEVVVFNRKLSQELMQKASAIILVSFSVTFFLLLLILMTNDVGIMDASYEIFSATATVGLSRALTPNLNSIGKLIVILAMYLGRIGPISMALFFNYRGMDKNSISFAEGRFFVG